MVYTLVCFLHCIDDETAIAKVKAKLVEASQVYIKDKETIDWHVMQDVSDPRKFTIVERFVDEGSQTEHLENPYFATFGPYIRPLLTKDLEVLRHEEMNTSEMVDGA